MGKFSNLETDIFDLFGSAEWQAESIPSFPANFFPENVTGSFIRHSIVPSGETLYANSVGGLLMVEIFTAAGRGPTASSEIADTLDAHFQQKTHGSTQFFRSNLGAVVKDPDNPTLARAIYQIPFSYFGVNS